MVDRVGYAPWSRSELKRECSAVDHFPTAHLLLCSGLHLITSTSRRHRHRTHRRCSDPPVTGGGSVLLVLSLYLIHGTQVMSPYPFGLRLFNLRLHAPLHFDNVDTKVGGLNSTGASPPHSQHSALVRPKLLQSVCIVHSSMTQPALPGQQLQLMSKPNLISRIVNFI